MADKDISTEESLDKTNKAVETEDDTSEDETLDDETQDNAEDDAESNDDDDSEDDSDDDDDEDKTEDDSDEEEEEDSEFKKAFSQIKGDTLEEYAPNLEEAYRKSSREGKRLSTEKKEVQDKLDKINGVVAKNPELAKLISDETLEGQPNPTVDPALLKARQDMEEQMAKDYEDFAGNYPELDSDEDLQAELLENLEIIGERSRKKGKIPKMSEALPMAWRMMGREEKKEDDKKAKIAEAAKKTASKSKTASAKKASSKNEQQLSAEQIAYGKKYGLTEKQLLENLK